MTGQPTTNLPGQFEARLRLTEHDGSIFAAFDALGLGFDHAAAIDYLQGARAFRQATVIDAPGASCPRSDAGLTARLAGVCMAFALTCVEADRLRVSGGERL